MPKKKTLKTSVKKSPLKKTGAAKAAHGKRSAPPAGSGARPSAPEHAAGIFSKVFDTNPIATAVSTVEEGIFIQVNRAFLEFTGYSEEEVVSRSARELSIWALPEERSFVIGQLRAGGHVHNYEIKMRMKSGAIRNCLFSADFVTMNSETLMLSMALDITDRVNAERDLADKEAKYRLLIENMSDSLWVLDLETMKFIYNTPSSVNILGYSEAESFGLNVTDVVAPDQLEMVGRMIAEELERDGRAGVDPNRTKTIELKQLHRNGSFVWTEMTMRFLRDGAGKPARIIGVSRNVTERKSAEEKLKESQEAYRDVVENSPIGIFRTCPPGRFVMVNPAMARMFGCDTVEEFRERVNNEAAPIYYNIEDQKHFLYLIQTYKGFSNVEFKCKNRDGDPFWVMASCRAFSDDKDRITAIEGFFIDISDRKRAEEGLKNSREYLQTMLKEKELLLSEIHHRVKNNMQIISSLLGLQAAHVKDGRDRQLFAESQNRVRSMALVHEKLYRSESFVGIDFQEYITDLLKELFGSYFLAEKVNVSVNARDVNIAIDDIIPCSLIIHELVSNALKHAFPGERRGTVTIDFYREGDEKVLRVRDDGIGLPGGFEFAHAGSLGLQLVNALANQLKGTLLFDGSAGADFTIRFRGQL